MNIEKLKNEWFPIMFEKDLKKKPISKILLGQKIVIFRIKDEILCFEDRCPHRNVPLSNGEIIGDKIRCNYHGWCFTKNAEYLCNKDIKIKKFFVKVEENLIWISLNNNKDFTNLFKMPKEFESKFSIKILKSDFIHTIENFLDPLHTPYIHKGLLRNIGQQKMKISQLLDDFSFKTIYDLENKQNGLINKLFDNGIDKNIATFIYPSFAKIEYLKQNSLIFDVSIFFVPLEKGEVQMVIKVSLLKTIIPSFLKFLVLKPFLELAFYQDKKILEIQYKNSKYFKEESIIDNKDLVINHLLYFLKDKEKPQNKEFLLEI
ncbi:Rieske 2Fe-2S domain-containing protein [Arcobacter vandammei]|uniref:Rieske 2Fe-2S domain-containing protein n=1 Tax=Arcobacter vandammei TaxID=2782243 RepID=UPI0018E04E30